GLAIVAAVAKGHGAEVMVKSRPSQGSTFILTMPLLPRGGALENEDPPEPGEAAQGVAVRLE
ncbi:ATP-binding protein, partial [Achromobacter sp. Marseille-Q0513]|uniref:ATP-binding protein n=1 Tax=Achromobacter sp. Marseille-Q0513 TaxID=2829161 RepID=UPI001B8F14BE